MNKPLISVIIPVYNASSFIWRCLNSLIKQDYKNLEFVLIDDGSTDDSLTMINEYKKDDDRFIVLSQKNQWAWEARNNWIKLAKWDYITFVDADDTLENDAIQELVSALDNNTDIVISWIKIVDKYGNYRWEFVPNKALWKRAELKFTSTQFKLYRHKLLIDNGIKFWNCKIHEDNLFNIKAFSVTDKIKILNLKKYIYYEYNDDSLTAKMKNDVCDWIVVSDLLTKLIDILLQYKKYNLTMCRFLCLKILIQDVLTYKSWPDINDIYLKNYYLIEKKLWKITLYYQKGETFLINISVNIFVLLTKIRLSKVIFLLKSIIR